MRFAAIIALVFGCSAAARAETEEQRVDREFAAYGKGNSPGCALGVIRDGSFVYRKGYGMASLELGVPLTSQSVFYMGSISKQFTAASVVLAAEKGFLSLDDDVRKYIPEIPDYGERITLRQMLHHTSGFRDVLALLGISGRNAEDIHPTDELIQLVARQKGLNYRPGDEYLYSNTNYFLAAEVIKRATGKPLSAFAAENIFRPLGMTHTRFYDDRTAVIPGRVPAYRPGKDGSFLVNWSTNFEKVGDGGLMSSVDDLIFWDRNFYENRLGKGTLLKEMQTRGVLNSGKPIAYALGLEIGKYRGLPVVEHGGALFGYRTELLRFPEQRFTVVCLCNLATAGPSGLSRKVADIYLEGKLAPLPVQGDAPAGLPSEASALAGTYRDGRTHSVFTFAATGGNLTAFGMTFKPAGANRFEVPSGMKAVFDRRTVTVEDEDETLFQGEKIEVPQLNPTALVGYAGTFSSTELDAQYKIWVEGNALMVRAGWSPATRLDPVARDEFSAAGEMTLVFQRDGNGQVSGLTVFEGRIRNVAFVKVR
ncbi:MAG: serine hydrolase [Bryobacteraceae bacterium]